MATPSYKVTDLIPPVRQHTFALEIDPTGLIDDEAEFIALNGFDWSNSSLQPVEGDELDRGSRNHLNNPAFSLGHVLREKNSNLLGS